jgi:hypothetical protein
MAQFEPGQSGNPRGRPTGSKNRSTKLLESFEDDLPALIAVTKEKALQGDMTAMRLLLDRGLPVRKPVSPVFDIPELAMASTLTEQAQAVISGVSRGFIPPDVGSQLIVAIGATAKVLETDEVVRRIIQLEQTVRVNGDRRQEVLC